MRKQYITEKAPVLMSTSVQHVNDDVINVQLPYDPDHPTEPELQDGNFHPVLLHGSIEHLSSDSKNIKEFLNRLAKYIGNKSIDTNKANNIEDLKSIGEAVWNLVVSIYSLGWDYLYADNNKNSFRQKVSFKCTPKLSLNFVYFFLKKGVCHFISLYN